jgi:hypothetical protein
VLPLLMSSWVGFEAVAGRARGAFGVLLLLGSSSSVGGEGLEEKIVEDIVKAQDVVVVWIPIMGFVVVVRKVGA